MEFNRSCKNEKAPKKRGGGAANGTKYAGRSGFVQLELSDFPEMKEAVEKLYSRAEGLRLVSGRPEIANLKQQQQQEAAAAAEAEQQQPQEAAAATAAEQQQEQEAAAAEEGP
ncbi:hypothetical protein ENH_00053120 [Eimeria necatrix]|uniref:Uncharacterized protein n=1 Tax=Eimeria necatrix TaxID=51315 RepID=U6ML63_9EIME|nr:hypothetical protein ENH_00053120 [Eimeria necatrix]CDJ63813.1 hypothetical protein ENH_00053120 [Eimeria necatrix]